MGLCHTSVRLSFLYVFLTRKQKSIEKLSNQCTNILHESSWLGLHSSGQMASQYVGSALGRHVMFLVIITATAATIAATYYSPVSVTQ